MALTTLSYKEAQKIIDLYSNILIRSENLGLNNRFRYSELKGYDIYDIDNALKLTSAYRVFTCTTRNEDTVKKLKQDASLDGGACMSFFNLFEPDNIVQELNKIDITESDAVLKFIKIRDNSLKSKLLEDFSRCEAHNSFLNYCLKLDIADQDFWEKIYARLGITWDERDEYDEIYFIIQNKNYYFSNKKVIDVNNLEITVDLKKAESTNSSIYTQYKLYVDNFISLIVLLIGLIYLPIRNMAFAVLALTGIITLIILRKEKTNNTLHHALNYLYIAIYLIGTFIKVIGFYICLLAVALELFTLIRKIVDLQKSDIK